MSTIDKFIEKLAIRLKRTPSPGLVTSADISNAQRILGFSLPPSYLKLITTCSFNDVPHFVYWLGKDVPQGIELLYINKIAPVPPFLIAVSGDGGGDEFCFDTREIDDAGEYPIVRVDHETQNEDSTTFEQVSPNLGAFLLELL